MLRAFAVALFIARVATVAAQGTSAPSTPQTSTTRLLPVSGILTDPTGTPLTGTVVITLTLFDAAEHGTVLWSETQQVQVDARGRYTAYLGMTTPVPQAAFSHEQARWLGIEVGGRELPRIMLVAVPYALRAADAETLGGTPRSAFVTRGLDGRYQAAAGTAVAEPLIDGSGTPGQMAKFTSATEIGSSIITESATNRVGIGTTDPTESGQLDSKVTIRNTDGATALAISNQTGTPRFALNTNADGSWITYDRASGGFLPGIAQRGGRVGIATTDPQGGGVVDSKFTVRNLDNNTGIAVLNETNARRFALNTRANGSWLLYDGVNGTWNSGLRQVNGSVGIGSEPFARIYVQENLTNQSAAVLRIENPATAFPAVQVSTISTNNFALTALNSNTGPALLATVFGTSATALRIDVPASSSGNLIQGRRGSTSVFRVDGDGDVFAPSYTVGGADFAEEVEPAAPLETYDPGDVLVVAADRDRTISRATDAYATTVIGIYSTRPGIVASPYAADDPRRTGTIPVAMVGIVPCKVSAENGAIARGDLLVTSATPGHAMKGTDRSRLTGAIVGKALEPLASGTGKILIAVTLQ